MRSGVWVIVLALMITACNVDAPPDMAKLKAPAATRIITLAPHLTELVFSVGAGDRLVGVVEYSDFPSAALEIPRIGDAFRVDYEAIAELDPDLILAWQSGTPREVVDRLGQLGYRIVTIEAGSLNQVADSLRVIGQLVGTVQIAAAAATAFEHSLEEIRSTTDERAPIAVFYQVSSQPLFTISRQHVIGEAIELCGGKNVFADLVGLSPAISPEAVIEAAPGVIIATRYTDDESAENPLAVWYQWSSIPAVRDGNLFLVDANLMTRPSIRILDGVRELCARIATAQRKGV